MASRARGIFATGADRPDSDVRSGRGRLDVRAGGPVEAGGDALIAFLVDGLCLLGVASRLRCAQLAGEHLAGLIE